MDKTPGTLTFNFIQDEPAKADAFGSHGRVASAIAQVICSAQNFKVIGLLGPWGAGKSTVVKLVEQHLEQHGDIDTHLFYYDAWLHQNDPPRRAFLETLIHFLAAEKLTTLEDWQERLDQLNGQIEDSEVTSTPTLTTSGRIIAFSLLLWPVALPFVGHDAFKAAFKSNATDLEAWSFVLGAIGVLLPFVIAAGFYFSWRPIKWPFRRLFWKKYNWTTHKNPHQKESILSLVMNKEVQRHRNRVVRSPDPTAIEFQDIFREIMEKVNADDRRFLFVIDNLDRLPEDDALAMWGTIRSFFLGAQETNHVRRVGRLPTVILPIDETAVQRMYSSSQHDNARALAKSFMDKTFDLTFRVTRPVLSNWNAYLEKQMASVFGPNMPKEWPYITSRLYERYFVGAAEPDVTPRTINTLINDIAALWLQWGPSGLNFASIAYYAIWQQSIDQNIMQAVATPVAPGIADLDPDWRRSIAALHFGTSPEDAAQILIDQPLRKAIADRNLGDFAALTTMPSFDKVIGRQIEEFVGTDGVDVKAVLNMAFLLNSLSTESGVWIGHAWRGIRSALRRSAEWRALGETDVESLKTVIAHCPSLEFGSLVLTLNTKLGSLNPVVFDTPATTANFVDIWGLVQQAARANAMSLPEIRVNGPASVYLRVAAAGRSHSDLLTRWMSDASDAQIVQELANTLMEQPRAATALGMFEAISGLDRKWPWETLINAATAVVRDQNASYPGMSGALQILGRLRPTEKSAKTQIKTLSDNGQLTNRLTEAYGASNDAVTARVSALVLLTNPNVQLPDTGNWGARFAKAPQLASMIDSSLTTFDSKDNSQTLITAAVNFPVWGQIVRAVLSRRIQNETLGRLDIAAVIANLDQYLIYVDEPLRSEFLLQIASCETFWDELGKVSLDGSVLTLLRSLISAQTDSIATAARKFLTKGLNDVSTERWTTAIRGGGEPLTIADDLRKIASLQVGSHLFDALQSLVQDVLVTSDTALRGRLFTASTYLGTNARPILFKAVRDRIYGGVAVADLAAFLDAGGESFLRTASFADEPDASVRHVVLPLLNEPNGLVWLESHSASVQVWLGGSDEGTRDFLSERLSSKARSDNDQQERLRNLRATWSLREVGAPTANENDAASNKEDAS